MSQKDTKQELKPEPSSDTTSRVRRNANVAIRSEPTGSSALSRSIQNPVNEPGCSTSVAQSGDNRAIAGTFQSGFRAGNPGQRTRTEHDARKAATFTEPAPTPGTSSEKAGEENVGLRNPELQQNQTEEIEIIFMKNVQATDCSFCGIKLNVGEGVTLQKCLHEYCRRCLQLAIETLKELTTIPCAIAECGGYITDGEVKEIVTPEVYEEYIDRSVNIARKKMKNAFQCVTPNCKGWCEYELGRKTFVCPVCSKSNCMTCQAVHDGLTCELYQSLKNTDQLAKVDELMERERRSGWSQLLHIMKIGDNNTADLHMTLQRIESLELIANCTKFECPICFSEINVGEGIILKECLHLFCKDCLTAHVEHSDEATIKCPYIDDNYSCICFVQEREIKHLVPPNIYDKHLERSIKLGESSMENTFHCKTPDCRGWCVYDVGARRYDCEVCSKTNCISCNAIHDGISCEDHRNGIVQNNNDKKSAEAIQALIDSGKAMRCPGCKIPVEKVIGCDMVKCVACKMVICWATKGPRWGPKGTGDESGGCRCRVDNKKCHPDCGYCH